MMHVSSYTGILYEQKGRNQWAGQLSIANQNENSEKAATAATELVASVAALNITRISSAPIVDVSKIYQHQDNFSSNRRDNN